MNLVGKEVSSSAMPADLPISSEDQIKTEAFMQRFQIDNVQESNAVICKINVAPRVNPHLHKFSLTCLHYVRTTSVE